MQGSVDRVKPLLRERWQGLVVDDRLMNFVRKRGDILQRNDPVFDKAANHLPAYADLNSAAREFMPGGVTFRIPLVAHFRIGERMFPRCLIRVVLWIEDGFD